MGSLLTTDTSTCSNIIMVGSWAVATRRKPNIAATYVLLYLQMAKMMLIKLLEVEVVTGMSHLALEKCRS